LNSTDIDPIMTKERVHQGLVIFIVFLFAASAIGYLLFPSSMLGVVGIQSNDQMDFLVRTLAAAFVAMLPGTWNARKKANPSLYPSVILGLAIYMFLSSAVDLHALLTHIVNGASIPSIILRVLIGGLLLWLMPRR
jgi:uncharacterized membrane-anchored protein YitT (DUF2179 family)